MRTQLVTAAALAIACGQAIGQIYSNAGGLNDPDKVGLATGLVTRSGVAAPAGFLWSEIDFGNTSNGSTVSLTGAGPNFRLSDDFTVPAGEIWRVKTLRTYMYRTGSPATESVVATGNIRVWNGVPEALGSTIVFGDTTTNRVVGQTNTNLYRVFGTTAPAGGTPTAPGTTRLVRAVDFDLGGTVLGPGTYWIDYQVTPTVAGSAIFNPTITTTDGSRGFVTGSAARQNTAAATWATVVDTGNPAALADIPLDLAFNIYGRRAGFRVALLAADSTAANLADAQAKILGTGMFNAVDVITLNPPNPTPTLAQLLPYDAVMVWTNSTPTNNVALGDVLADYADAGRGVVVAVFANSTANNTRWIDGRWRTGGYEVIASGGGNTSGAGSLGAVLVPNHPIMQNVSVFTATNAFRPTQTAVCATCTKIALWADGKTFAAVHDGKPNRADLGFFPPSSAVNATYWDPAVSHGAAAMANALMYVSEYGRCRVDLNFDGIVDFNDYLEFLNLYNTNDLRVDLNFDGQVDFNDYLEFLNQYNIGC